MKALLVGSSPETVELVSLCLGMLWPGVTLLSATEGGKGIALVEAEAPDLVVLDVNLPDREGFDVLQSIRLFSDVPVVVLTARVQGKDRIRSLDLGADDYVSKPVNHVELMARLRAVVQRSRVDKDRSAKAALEAGDIHIDLVGRSACRGGQALSLTPIEYGLLTHLVQHEGRAISRRALLHRLWGDEFPEGVSYLDSYLNRLRQKLGDDTGAPRILLEEGGVGYKFLKSVG